MTSPSHSISSAPTITVAAPSEASPPAIVEPQANNTPPLFTRTPPETLAPESQQTSPALTTTPPVIFPDNGVVPGIKGGPVLHSVAASAPSLKTASTNP